MRKINTLVIVILIFTVLIFPLAALPKTESGEKKPVGAGYVPPADFGSSTESKAETESGVSSGTAKEEKRAETVRVYNPKTKTTEKMDMYEYIYGVVCGECPMLYHEEAIKAQIVAAHTYTLYCINNNAQNDYDLTTEPETSQAYISREQALKNWGSNAKAYDEKLKSLMDEVWKKIIIYEGKPILAAYHAISSGKTESAEGCWGKAIPYLVSSQSEGDKLAEKYETKVSVAIAEAEETLKTLGISATQLKSAEAKTTDCGTVLELNCGEATVTGEQIRAAFSLRSANFDRKVTSKTVTFTVRGYGHGVGMSQNGANFMAKAGSTYEEILKHYYKGVTLENNP